MNAGIYIHIPFCRWRCSYCDFATGMYQSALAAKYVGAVVNEIGTWSEVESAEAVDTIYFGGGTPSLLSPEQIALMLRSANDRFNVLPNAEVTMEINPGTVNAVQSPQHETEIESESAPDLLTEFRLLGVNRASFGAQTFDDDELRQLGRTHTSADIGLTFRHLREAGFENINFDLIAGLPGQTPAGWNRNLDEALALRPEHLSLYLLDVHEGTPLADQIRRGMRPAPDDDLAAEMYRVMLERVCEAGYEHYEISNFCLPGYESRHNTKYWVGAPYYGFGCSAHSYDGRSRRWANERDTANYVGLVEQGRSVIVERVELDALEARAEAVFLGLRLMSGIDRTVHRSRFGVDLGDDQANDIKRLRDAGLIEINEQLVRLTPKGALLSNEVFAALA